MSGFTHLHVHSGYSLLDGAARIPELVSRAKELGMTALALTDHGAMYGIIEFYKECVKQGIKPILGFEAYVAPGSLKDKSAGERDYSHLVLLAKNETGYHNLMKLSSIAFIDGFYYKPRIDYTLLEQYHDGIICLSACLAGDIPRLLTRNCYNEAKALTERLRGIFGEDFYIELQDHGMPEQKAILPELARLAKELGIETVATNDIHYLYQTDAEAQDVLLCIQTAKTVTEAKRMQMGAAEFYFKSEEEMLRALAAYPESVANTAKVADKCEHYKIKFGERHLPGYTAPNGMTNPEYLKEICENGLKKKMPNATPEIWERLRYEIGVINQMGFVDYFLIVWDFVNYAHEHGIFVGPGRGSGAGSIAAYAMNITDIDPIKYDLIFERFLNPERVSMPDFDIDFCIERRQEVIDYVVQKYGADHVAQIITFGTMAAKAVIRDVGRALDLPYTDVDRISKMIPNEIGMTLPKAIEMVPELKQTLTDPQLKKLIELSLRLEGLPRHASTHAAGVVICANPTVEYVPLQRNEDAITTQFPKDTVEELGLLKMDFLGLRTLTVIRDTLDFIRQGGKVVPDLSALTYDDPAVFEMIAAGDTEGVFQLESIGMRQFMVQLKPDCFEDIIAGISLYRPGPMDEIPKYLQGKSDKENIRYAHPLLKPILANTYGCMVYQEQVMQIVRDLAGYSWGRSDLVRRAMAKKKHDVMAKEREYFVNGIVEDGKVVVPGAVRNGVSADIANHIFDSMMDFASYAFNKSHAAAYAVVGYRTAYLKKYYPVEFMTALMNSFIGGTTEKITEYISYCRKHKIAVYPPDINASMPKFSVENGNIRFGFAAIKNVGEALITQIVEERKRGGAYKDFSDVVRRNDMLNKRVAEGLIKAGCFDSTKARRVQLLRIYETVIGAAANDRKKKAEGQLSLFDMPDAKEVIECVMPALPDAPEFDIDMLLSLEKEATGIYMSGHPLSEYANTLDSLGATCSALTETDGTTYPRDGQPVRLGGIVTEVKTRPVKSGNGIMAYVTIEDLTGSFTLTVFPSAYTSFRSLLFEDSKIEVSGKFNVREDKGNTILVDNVKALRREVQTINSAPRPMPAVKRAKLYLRAPSTQEMVQKIKAIVVRSHGDMPVVIYDEAKKMKLELPAAYNITLNPFLRHELESLLGPENVKESATK